MYEALSVGIALNNHMCCTYTYVVCGGAGQAAPWWGEGDQVGVDGVVDALAGAVAVVGGVSPAFVGDEVCSALPGGGSAPLVDGGVVVHVADHHQGRRALDLQWVLRVGGRRRLSGTGQHVGGPLDVREGGGEAGAQRRVFRVVGDRKVPVTAPDRRVGVDGGFGERGNLGGGRGAVVQRSEAGGQVAPFGRVVHREDRSGEQGDCLPHRSRRWRCAGRVNQKIQRPVVVR